jgi:oligogalacturonide lyase
LAALPGIRLDQDARKGRKYPPERTLYADLSTEFTIERLTDPRHSSCLPAWYCRAMSRKGAFLLFSSDRSGNAQAYRMDLRRGTFQQLTQATALDTSSLTLAHDDRSFYYFDGPSLMNASLRNLRGKEVYRVPPDWGRGAGFSLAPDGSHAALVEAQATRSRLQLLRLPKGPAITLIESRAEIADPVPRPRGDEVLYRSGASARVIGYDGRRSRELPLAGGGALMALWAPGGETVLYLNVPEDPSKLNAIRECDPDANTERMLWSTSQFAHFAANGDASVFVGASRNKASPYILLLLRSSGRELTVCEHRASDPARSAPFFSGDSQRVCFQSDQHGKTAIYLVSLERLVEVTQAEFSPPSGRPRGG